MSHTITTLQSRVSTCAVSALIAVLLLVFHSPIAVAQNRATDSFEAQAEDELLACSAAKSKAHRILPMRLSGCPAVPGKSARIELRTDLCDCGKAAGRVSCTVSATAQCSTAYIAANSYAENSSGDEGAICGALKGRARSELEQRLSGTCVAPPPSTIRDSIETTFDKCECAMSSNGRRTCMINATAMCVRR